MIYHVLGVPHLAFIELRFFFQHVVGVPIMQVDKERIPGLFSIHKPTRTRGFFDTRFAYCATVEDFFRMKDSFARAEERITVFIGGAATELKECNVPCLHTPKFSMLELQQVLSIQQQEQDILRMHDARKVLLGTVQASSVIQRLLTLMYRIPNKADRDVINKNACRYLYGELRSPPDTGVTALDKLLRSDPARTLRTYVIHAINVGLEEGLKEIPESAEYEVRYLFNRRNSQQRQEKPTRQPKGKPRD